MSSNVASAPAFAELVNPGCHYANAPITEAVLDIHIAPPDGLSMQTLMQAYVGEEATYPIKKTPMVLQWQVTGGPETVASATTQTQTGFAFVGAGQDKVFQVRRDGFSFNKLRPYDRWESFRDEARRLWERYRRATQPTLVRMLSLRYLNRIDLPNPSELKDYFRIFPEVGREMPQYLDFFAVQLGMPMQDLGAKLLLNQASVPSPTPEVASILLDIQIFLQAEGGIREDAIWENFERFRIRKNQVFEACITDALRRRIS
jgi:uncharacterized protein (TIGR04255 family)